MTRRRAIPALLLLNLVLFGLWLTLRGGADRLVQVRRSFAPPDSESDLHLHWVRQLPPPLPAWPDQPKLQFDIAYRPTSNGRLLFVGSARTDSLTAYDIETGEERWRFFANGPVRFAPALWQDRVYFTSDDGYLYCLNATTGSLCWKVRGGPADRLILGNERLISTWPARGAPVVADGVVYFAAGIWPFMGAFLHAVDASTGKVVWTNDGDGSTFMIQPHYAEAFAGIAPQGSLAVSGDKLLVSNGRSVPACYDRFTGKQLHFKLGASRDGGGWNLAVQGGLYVNGDSAFDVATGRSLGTATEPSVLTAQFLYSCNGNECQAYSLKSINESKDRANDYYGGSWTLLQKRILPVAKLTAMAAQGSRLYAGGPGQVFAVSFGGDHTSFEWQAAIEGTPAHLIAEPGRLIVSTREGRLYGFGTGPARTEKYRAIPTPPLPADEWTEKAAAILNETRIGEGYAIAWGAGSGRLVTELVRRSSLRMIVIEPDASRAEGLRNELIAAGIHADRAAVLVVPFDQVQLPPYLASLMVAEEPGILPNERTFYRKLFQSLRPFGGVACLPLSDDERRILSELPQSRLRLCALGTLLIREGPLPGSGNWTHEHADAANTRVGKDMLVQAPLGLLWFGGPSHEGILPRHGHGPQPQVIDGRAIIEGPDILRAIDIYTGRLLWETRLPGVGKDFDELWHQPGANASGTNYISLSDGIYVAYGSTCVRLDPATGRKVSEFRFGDTPHPNPLPQGERAIIRLSSPLAGEGLGVRGECTCSYINVADDYLVLGVNPAAKGVRDRYSSVSASKQLLVLNRHTGKLLWTATAKHGFRNNAICIGGGRLYAIDRVSSDSSYAPWRSGSGDSRTADLARLQAFDLPTGKVLWSSDSDIFGTWLSYSQQHDVLIEAGRVARDTLYDEAAGMRAWRAGRGAPIWHQPRYSGPAMIHGDKILKDQSACWLLTGEPVMRTDPVTGRQVEWSWSRDYGCNTPMASQHLLTFRSGAAGYFDLANDGGTGNIGGFRSGCTNNLVVAGGVLTAPDYTRDCTCSYQNQSSLGLAPMPEAEMWTYFGRSELTGVVRRVGINLGAPGNRRAADGTLWLEHPRATPSLPLTITTNPANPDWFRRHSSWVQSPESPFVGASGARGITSLILTLTPTPSPYALTPADPLANRERTYTVRLHFVEPDNIGPGERVFDVALQGKAVLNDFDIVKEAGGSARVVVKEFRGIKVRQELTLTLTPAVGCTGNDPVLSGIEVRAEGW